jgi:hypothetical protein
MTLEDALLLVAATLDNRAMRDRAHGLRQSLETIRHYNPDLLRRPSGMLETGSRQSEDGMVRDTILLDQDGSVYLETSNGIGLTAREPMPGLTLETI